ncbi:hypothetical protein FKM82_011784 [Ascaphus truei]
MAAAASEPGPGEGGEAEPIPGEERLAELASKPGQAEPELNPITQCPEPRQIPAQAELETDPIPQEGREADPEPYLAPLPCPLDAEKVRMCSESEAISGEDGGTGLGCAVLSVQVTDAVSEVVGPDPEAVCAEQMEVHASAVPGDRGMAEHQPCPTQADREGTHEVVTEGAEGQRHCGIGAACEQSCAGGGQGPVTRVPDHAPVSVLVEPELEMEGRPELPPEESMPWPEMEGRPELPPEDSMPGPEMEGRPELPPEESMPGPKMEGRPDLPPEESMPGTELERRSELHPEESMPWPEMEGRPELPPEESVPWPEMEGRPELPTEESIPGPELEGIHELPPEKSMPGPEMVLRAMEGRPEPPPVESMPGPEMVIEETGGMTELPPEEHIPGPKMAIEMEGGPELPPEEIMPGHEMLPEKLEQPAEPVPEEIEMRPLTLPEGRAESPGLVTEDMEYVSESVSDAVKQVQEPFTEEMALLSELIPQNTEYVPASEKIEPLSEPVPEESEQGLDPCCEAKEPVSEPFHAEAGQGPDPISEEEHMLQLVTNEKDQWPEPICGKRDRCELEMAPVSVPVLKDTDQLPDLEEMSHEFEPVPKETDPQLALVPKQMECRSVQMTAEIKSELVFEQMECRSALLTADIKADQVAKQMEPGPEMFLNADSIRADTISGPGLILLETDLVPGPFPIETVSGFEKTSNITETVPLSQEADCEQIYWESEEESVPRDIVPEQPHAPMVVTEHEGSVELDTANSTETVCLEDRKLPSDVFESGTCVDDPDCSRAVLGTSGGPPLTGEIADLIPGSEVRVTLDHIIQDALVVSFRLGERIFSGVLMDLSKRFGPHGIPVTVHPKREYKNKPEEPIQLQSNSFHEETAVTSEEKGAVSEDISSIQSSEPCEVQNLWTSKPPPLFHEGAPYPPPLFIRDTYNQSIPQPPPRKIKRPKKKIYREEPTSIMNAIKLRPRQVLCDKCKNIVSDKKEMRKGGNDSYKQEDGKRRRHDSVTTMTKRLKTDHKVNGKSQDESQKRNAVSKVPNLADSRGKLVKVSSHAKAQLHTKKVLQSKNMEHAKAREVLKMAKEKVQKKQMETSASKNAHGKVHFTRRFQNPSSGTLPPRLRIKPQRYRNEENDSLLKTGLETMRSNKMDTKPQTRYSATRSAGETPSEIQSPSNGPEEVSSDIQDTGVCAPSHEQEEQQTLGKRGSKSNITVYMTLNQKTADSSSASVCSSDSTDDLKSSHSECSSTENFDFPPGSMHAPSSSSSSSSKEDKKLSNSLKIKVFSKNVSKCVTPDGRTICVGDIVWAKIYGFPWWPARILIITVSRKDNGLLVRQEARISWFGSPTTSFLALSQLSPFLENFQSRFNKKRKGLYRKAITEAAKAAKQLTPEVRALLTQFET